MSRLQYEPQDQNQPEPDDSMQLKRDRLGVSEDAAQSTQPEEKRLQYVDRLLKSAPMLAAPLGLADRVIARLKGSTPRTPNYSDGAGIMVGLSAASFIAIPILATIVFLLARSFFDEEVRTDVLDSMGNALSWVVGLPAEYPFISTLLLIALLLFLAMSGYLVWFWRGLVRSAKKLR